MDYVKKLMGFGGKHPTTMAPFSTLPTSAKPPKFNPSTSYISTLSAAAPPHTYIPSPIYSPHESLFKEASSTIHQQRKLAENMRCITQQSFQEFVKETTTPPHTNYAQSLERYVPTVPYGTQLTEQHRKYDTRPLPPNSLITELGWTHVATIAQRIQSHNHNSLIESFYAIALEARCTEHLRHKSRSIPLPPCLPMTTLTTVGKDMSIMVGSALRIGARIAEQTSVVREGFIRIAGKMEPCVVKISPVFSIPRLYKSRVEQKRDYQFSSQDIYDYLYPQLIMPMPIPQAAHNIQYPATVWSFNQPLMECYAGSVCAPEFFWGHFLCRNSENPGELYIIQIMPRFEKTLDDWIKTLIIAHDDFGREIRDPQSRQNIIPENTSTEFFIDRLIQGLAQLFIVTLPQLKRNSGFCHLDAKVDNIALIRLNPQITDLVFQVDALFQAGAQDGQIHIPSNGKRFNLFDFGFAFLVDNNGVGWLSRSSHKCEFASPLQFNNTSADIIQICISILQILVKEWPTAMQRLIASCLGLEAFRPSRKGQIDSRLIFIRPADYANTNTNAIIQLDGYAFLPERTDRFEAAKHFRYDTWRRLVQFLVSIVQLQETSSVMTACRWKPEILRFDPNIWTAQMYTGPTQLYNPYLTWYRMIFELTKNTKSLPVYTQTLPRLIEKTLPFQPTELAAGSSRLLYPEVIPNISQ